MSARSIALRNLAVLADRESARPRSAASRPRPAAGRCLPRRAWSQPLRPAWPSWMPTLAGVVGVHEIDDALPGRRLLVVPQAEAAGRDARVGRDAGHLAEDERRAAHARARRDAPGGNRSGTPSAAEYIAIGETTMRLGSVTPRSVIGREHRRRRRGRWSGSRRRRARRTSARSPPARPCRAGADSRG